MKYQKLLQEWVKEKEWDDEITYDQEANKSLLNFKVNINDQFFNTYIEGDEERDWLFIFMYCPFNVKKEKESDVLKLFNHIHGATYYGRLVLLDEGIVQYKQIMPLSGVEPNISLVQNVYSTAILVYETWLEDIAEVGLTKTSFKQWEENRLN